MRWNPRAASPHQNELFQGDAASQPSWDGLRISARVQEKLDCETPPAGVDKLAKTLRDLLEGRLEQLILTDNRTRILSCQVSSSRSRRIRLRLHWSFVTAEAKLLEEVAGFALGRFRGERRKRALEALRVHFDHRQGGTDTRGPLPSAKRQNPSPLNLEPQGLHFNLEQIQDRLSLLYFDGELKVPITWGRVPSRRPRAVSRPRQRTIHFGTYHSGQHLIRLHRALDQPHVPLYVVESVVYHEMLHAVLPAVSVGGRQRFHTPEFRRRERLFAEFDLAESWLQDHLRDLLDWREGARRVRRKETRR